MDQRSDNVLPTLRDFFNAEKTTYSERTSNDDPSRDKERFSGIPFSRVLSSSLRNNCPRPPEPANGAKHKRGFFCQSTKDGRGANISESAENFSGLQHSSNGKQKRWAKPQGLERNMEPRLQKSHSARVGLPNFPSIGNIQPSTNASSTSWFSRIKKMSNPFANLHPRRNPLVPPSGNVKHSVGETLSRNKRAFQRTSPVHLHACLNLEKQLGMPVFKFSLDHSDDVYVANTWLGYDDFPFVYTFHCVSGRRNRYVSEQGSKCLGMESSIVGQMQVSTRICLASKLDEDRGESIVTEFVLCDIAHARRSGSEQEKLRRSNSFKKGSALSRLKHSEKNESDGSIDSNPWPASDLHPGLEIAAIVIQDPFTSSKQNSYIEKHKKISRQEVKVIVPTGNHGLPNTENSCPLPILQRWRSGGGCDCSGWDMGCHLFVLESPTIRQFRDNQHLLELYVEGGKENTPAMTMAVVKEGEYEVDFHAKLSALQAFSVCVAVLHSTAERRNMPLSRCSSLKELIDMEPQDATRDVPLSSFMPNVTFSPIARV